MTNFPEKRLQVFVSSTFIDLKKERQAAVEAILAARHIPAGMELFAAGGASQMAVIRKWIDESDVFLLILGSRYGTVEPTSEKSYIHLEFEYARDKGKPIIALLIDETIKDKRVQKGKKLIDRGNSEKLEYFIKSVKSERYVSSWKDCKDIKIEIQKALSALSKKDELLGWVKRSENLPISHIKTLIFDIDGTILNSDRAFDDEKGKSLMEIFSKLILKGLYIVLITSNDYDQQRRRILQPFIDKGIAEHIFCFSDGGTRAFKYRKKGEQGDFEVIDEYSTPNTISKEQVDKIEGFFHEKLAEFIDEISLDTSSNLLMPSIELIRNPPGYIDIKIYPLKPTFLSSDSFNEFCARILDYSNNPPDKESNGSFKTDFSLVKNIPNSLVVRATGQDNESEVARFQGILYKYLLSNQKYQHLSKPEIEKRGGKKVICQIALKPFNDHKLREKFRDIIERSINEEYKDDFDVSIGGSTTIDIQIKGVDKAKAIRYLISDQKINPQDMIFFGDEFFKNGNDLPVALMEDEERPRFILNVGDKKRPIDPRVKDKIVTDGNGPDGTENYLRFILNQYF
ncbi:MAG: DUF4062 domain-containing protein [Candidatus Competibacteraceae bacterium]